MAIIKQRTVPRASQQAATSQKYISFMAKSSDSLHLNHTLASNARPSSHVESLHECRGHSKLPDFAEHFPLRTLGPKPLHFTLLATSRGTSRLIGGPFALELALTSDKRSTKNMFGARACRALSPPPHLPDLRCHPRCHRRHHLVMPWLDLHLEIYQRGPAVCPGKHKNRKDFFFKERGGVWGGDTNDRLRQRAHSGHLTCLCCWRRLSRLWRLL